MEANNRALTLSYFTLIYNILEGILSVAAGSSLKAISLVGFGLDSFVESLSGGIVIWNLQKAKHHQESHSDPREAKAIRMIAYTFFVLGIYMTYESLRKLIQHEAPHPSLFGVVLAVVSITVMTTLYQQKKKIGLDSHDRALVADSKQALACIYMSISLLIGLGLNYFFSLWWTDAVAGLAIASFLFREGYNIYIGKELCLH